MQKPQQRKYHSSCNRSVHRGTAHGKQEVKVCKRKTPHLFLMRSFLSPYGDGTSTAGIQIGRGLFSPPYGDGTYDREWSEEEIPFSPPCGDGTISLDGEKTASIVFAPLRGWYHLPASGTAERLVFAPLRGWYLTGQQIPRLFHVFAPLRGWYAYGDSALSGHGVFAPLRGWYMDFT